MTEESDPHPYVEVKALRDSAKAKSDTQEPLPEKSKSRPYIKYLAGILVVAGATLVALTLLLAGDGDTAEANSEVGSEPATVVDLDEVVEIDDEEETLVLSSPNCDEEISHTIGEQLPSWLRFDDAGELEVRVRLIPEELWVSPGDPELDEFICQGAS